MKSVATRTFMTTGMAVGMIISCGAEESVPLENYFASAATQPAGGPLPGIDPAEFEATKAAFSTVEGPSDGLGPIFNETACGNCHTLGGIGGAGEQIERRFGRFANGAFDPLDSKGGSLRQLFALKPFTAADGRTCNVPIENEPPETTVHNVGRLTTPLFGLGLVDVMPDSFFDQLAASEPAAVRGIVNRVTVLLPNPEDPTQHLGQLRVGRFGWKAGVASLVQFSADAYVNEMGITTAHCIGGKTVLDFATESAPNGTRQSLGCDDLAPVQTTPGVPAGVDDAAGDCSVTPDVIQDDVLEFFEFMTALAPPTRDLSDAVAVNAGAPLFNSIGCNGCHVTTTFRTPAVTNTDVPGNFAFNPYSDFLVHDMGALGDQIGNKGDSLEVTRRMRTAPLWGIRFRNKLLHDGRTNDIPTAIRAHAGQGAAAATAFTRLSAANQHNVVQFVRSL
jgi:CxxC motif-containing protein (DUF1111 family)